MNRWGLLLLLSTLSIFLGIVSTVFVVGKLVAYPYAGFPGWNCLFWVSVLLFVGALGCRKILYTKWG